MSSEFVQIISLESNDKFYLIKPPTYESLIQELNETHNFNYMYIKLGGNLVKLDESKYTEPYSEIYISNKEINPCGPIWDSNNISDTYNILPNNISALSRENQPVINTSNFSS